MLDQTSYFKARAKIISGKMGKVERPESESNVAHTTTPNYRVYARTLAEIGRDAAELGVAVMARRKEYLSGNEPGGGMAERERDLFDSDTAKALSQLASLLESLATRVQRDGTLRKSDEKEHLRIATAQLEKQLKALGKVVTDMRKLRVRQTQSRAQMTRLSSLAEWAGRREEEEGRASGRTSPSEHTRHSHTQPVVRRRAVYKPDETKKEQGSVLMEEEERKEDEMVERMSDKEKAQLHAESEAVYSRLARVNQDVEGLESQLAEIQRLQETFTEKILDQEKDIDVINEQAIHTTENIKDGNEWIRQAISNSAGRRVVVLFCLVVITFTLLFLDWYNP